MTRIESPGREEPQADLDRRLLIAAPTGRDAEVLGKLLHEIDIEIRICSDLEETCRSIAQGAIGAIIAEEALFPNHPGPLFDVLSRQPEWSEFPLIVMTSEESHDRCWRLMDAMVGSAHFIVLPRPVRKVTLVSSVRTAVRSRERQYQVREELAKRQRVEAALRKSEERLRLAHQIAHVGTFEWDIKNNINMWSPEIEALYGLKPGTFEGTYEDWAKRVHPDDLPEAERQARESLESGELHAEWRVVWPDGSIRWLAARTRVFYDGHGNPSRMLGINLDITDRKQAEEALRDADRRKDEFLATLAHELRNPLAPIRTGLQVMRMTTDMPEKFEEVRATMERQVEQLVVLVDDLLDVSRITQGKLQLRSSCVRLDEILQTSVEATRSFLEEANHTFVLEVPPEPIFLDADPHRLAQVFSNLLNNAAKYTPNGGQVRMAAWRQAEEVVVSVRDSGVGIAPEMLDRIFEMFAQGEGSEDRMKAGLGLGLTLVKSLVEMHGGTIQVRSEGIGKGSEFEVYLPIATPTKTQLAAPSTPEHTSADRKTCRILVVDDKVEAANLMAVALRLLGHEVVTAGDGERAVERAAEYQPDVIVLDIGLPKMDGYEACHRIRALPNGDKVTIVALTGWGQAEDKQRAKDAGFDRHFTKPVDVAELKPLLVPID